MFHRITANAARELIEGREPLILDARDTHSFNLGRIQGAVHLNSQAFYTVVQRVPREKPLLVYCYHGNASQDFARMLTSSGFREVIQSGWWFQRLVRSEINASPGRPAWRRKLGSNLAPCSMPRGCIGGANRISI